MATRKLPPTYPTEGPGMYKRAGSKNWYVRVHVPPSAGLGDRHIERSLRTSDRTEAARRLHVVVGKIKAEIAVMLRDGTGNLKSPGLRQPTEPDAWAQWWREQVIADGGDPEGDVPLGWEVALEDEVERRLGPVINVERDRAGEHPVYAEEAERNAMELYKVAKGERRPPDQGLERYISESRLKARYSERIKRAVGRLKTWMRGRPSGADIGGLTKRDAADFVDHLLGLGLTTATVNSLSSSLATYWGWMERRGLASANPWRDQQRRPGENEGAKVRAFTDAEAAALLSGRTTLTLHDLMRIAALSGMRINEIANLTVADVADGVFNVQAAKTKAGIRRVPIHPSLEAIVARRIKGKAATAFLIEELKAPASRSKERSAKASEAFTRYRRSLDLDDRRDGQRRSNITFHSWRHYFTTAALQANNPQHLVSAVVGHEAGRETMTMRVYDSGPSDAQLRAVVESVQLPGGVPADSPPGAKMGSVISSRRRTTRAAA